MNHVSSKEGQEDWQDMPVTKVPVSNNLQHNSRDLVVAIARGDWKVAEKIERALRKRRSVQ